MKSIGSWPLDIPTLILAAGLASASAASATSLLDWSTVSWDPGDMTRTYTLIQDDVDVTITVSTTPSAPGLPAGTFLTYSGIGPAQPTPCNTVASPNKDGAPAPGTYPSDRFGTKLDLGIAFDPAANNNQSVLIRLKFTNAGSGPTGPPKPVGTLKFEISDIDWSQAGTDCVTGLATEAWRADQVVITAENTGTPVTAFTLIPLDSVLKTFTINPYNVATANGNRFGGSPSGTPSVGNDLGTVVVDFGASLVTDVLISYNESAFGQLCDPSAPQGCAGTPLVNVDPGYRGIGLFGLTTFPVELMDFTIE